MANDLPEDCLVAILKQLSRDDLKSASLVSKRFHSISNNLIFNLKISLSEVQHLLLARLLHRFTSLKSIQFHRRDCRPTRDGSVLQIAHSGLKNLQELVLWTQKRLPLKGIKELGFLKMTNLKILRCPNVKFITDGDLSLIASSLPWLEELDISSDRWLGSVGVTDRGIAELAANLSGLLRINMSGNRLISDQSLYSLLFGCVCITEIGCAGCEGITVNGLIDAICGYSNLTSLKFGKFDYDRSDLNRCYLICHAPKGQDILEAIVGANLPLDKLIVETRSNGPSHWVLYNDFSQWVKFLCDTKAIELRGTVERCTYTGFNRFYPSALNNATFCMFVENCPSLAEFEFSLTDLGAKPAQTLVLGEKYHVMETLKLNSNMYLNDETLIKIVQSFPNLERLEVCKCPQVTEKSIGYVVNNCSQIKHLKMDGGETKSAPWGEEDGQFAELKLEVLGVSRTRIDGRGMDMIAKRCPHLVCLEIEDCPDVSENDVKELMERCKKLREVRLGERGSELSFDDVPDWMMVSEVRRASQKSIVHKLVRKMM